MLYDWIYQRELKIRIAFTILLLLFNGLALIYIIDFYGYDELFKYEGGLIEHETDIRSFFFILFPCWLANIFYLAVTLIKIKFEVKK